MSKAWFLENHGIKLFINADKLPTNKELAVDIETDEADNPISIAVCGDDKSVYVYFELDKRIELLNELKTRQLIAHNGKSDITWLERYGFTMGHLTYDTMLGEYVLASSSPQFGLKPLAKKHLGYEWPSYKDITEGKDFIAEACAHSPELYIAKIKTFKTKPSITENKLPKRLPLYLHPYETIANYTGWDAYATFMLRQRQFKRTSETAKTFMEKIEFPTAAVLQQVEKRGIKVNTAKLLEVHKKFRKEAYTAKRAFGLHVGFDVLISSSSQVLEALNKYGIRVENTNEDTLHEFKDNSPVKELLAYRHAAKICSTYTKPLYKRAMESVDRRIHCAFMQHTITGRLGCRNPNLQNQPPELRDCFEAEDGSVFVNADYSQIELRVPAHFSGEPIMVNTFVEGKKKMHQVTADEIGKSYKVGKTVNFLLTNSGGPRRLAEVAEILLSEAQEAYDNHKIKFATYWAWVDEQIRLARRVGGVTTLYGRFVPLPDLRNPDPYIRKAAERQAISIKVQGSAADMMKAAMIKLAKKYDLYPVVSVHDELMFEVPIDKSKETELKVREVMEGIVKLRVPLVVDVGVGSTWATAKKKD